MKCRSRTASRRRFPPAAQVVSGRLVNFPMEKWAASADDPRCGRPRREPAARPRTPGHNPGGGRAPERRPPNRGVQNRGRQARPARLDAGAAGQSGRRPPERPAALTIGPVPFPLRAAGDRPSMPCLALLNGLQQRHDWINRHDLHPCSPPPARQPRPLAGRDEQGKKFLTAGILVTQQNFVRLRSP